MNVPSINGGLPPVQDLQDPQEIQPHEGPSSPERQEVLTLMEKKMASGETLSVLTPRLSPPRTTGSLQQTGAGPEGSGGREALLGSVTNEAMADIYQVMSLFYEVFKEERKASREARLAERSLQMSEMEAHVKELKSAATTAFATALAGAAISIGMLGWSASSLAKGVQTKLQLNRVKAYQMADAKVASCEAQLAKLTNTRASDPRVQAAQQKVASLEVKVADLERRVPAEPTTVRERAAQMDLETYRRQLNAARNELRSVDSYQPKIQELTTQKEAALRQRATLEQKLKPEDGALKERTLENEAKLKDMEVHADKMLKSVDMINQAGHATSQIAQASGTLVEKGKEADAEKHKAESAKWQTKAEEETEFMKNLSELIQSVQSKLQAINESQTETMRSIFRV